MADKKSFLMYTSYLDNVVLLSDEEAGKLLKAIYAYVNGNEVPELDRILQLTFNPIKSHLERDMKKYNDICRKRSENVQKRWSKTKNTNEYNCIQNDTTYTDNENKNEKENVNENINANANANAYENKYEPQCGNKPALTQTEYAELCEQYGKADTDRYVALIDRYIEYAPDKYSDPYKILKTWMGNAIFG